MHSVRPSSRDAVIEAAFQTFSKTPGASLADVAERAGVGRATLHRHFKGRDDLMVELARTAVRELDAAVDAAVVEARSHTEGLRLSLEAIIPLADRYWFLSREPVENDPGITADYARQMHELAEAVDSAKQEGAFDAAAPTAWIVQAFDNLVYAAWEMVRAGDATPGQAAALAWRTLTTGLGGPNDDR